MTTLLQLGVSSIHVPISLFFRLLKLTSQATFLTSSESISRNSGANFFCFHHKRRAGKKFSFSSSVPVEDGINITVELDKTNTSQWLAIKKGKRGGGGIQAQSARREVREKLQRSRYKEASVYNEALSFFLFLSLLFVCLFVYSFVLSFCQVGV